MGLFLFLLLSILPGGPALAGTIIAVEAVEQGAIIRFDGYVHSARVFGLTGPSRIAVDVVGAKAGQTRGFTQAGVMRQGQFNPDTARLVLDLTQNMTVKDARFANEGKSLRLWIAPAAATGFLDRLA